MRRSGFTLIELMVAVAVLAIVVALAAPSLRRYVEVQRLRAVNSQLVTDLQFARSEAVSRNARVRVTFRGDASQSCYSIYTYSNNLVSCDCRLANPCGAAGAGYTEIRTTRVPFSGRVRMVPDAGQPIEFAFEPLAGSLYTIPIDAAYTPLPSYTVRVRLDAQRELYTIVGQSGRPTVCRPSASQLQEAAC